MGRNMIPFMRWTYCTLLLLLTGVATIWLRVAIEPYLPPGEWHAMLSALFIFVLWPLLAWSLRSLVRVDLTNPCSMLWWW
jgi:succinate dehydrogenase hydrophobic anchor subunit